MNIRIKNNKNTKSKYIRGDNPIHWKSRNVSSFPRISVTLWNRLSMYKYVIQLYK